MRKGQTSTPFMIIISFLGFLMILAIVNGIQQRTGDYVKGESVQIQSDRVVNSVLILESVREGHLEFEMDGYKISVDGNNITVGYEDKNASSLIDTDMVDYDRIESLKFKKVDSKLCVRKKIESGDKVLVIEPGGC